MCNLGINCITYSRFNFVFCRLSDDEEQSSGMTDKDKSDQGMYLGKIYDLLLLF